MKPKWVYFLFALSGGASLIGEVAWIRYLESFLGVSSFSLALVVTAFMSGLSLGSACFSRVSFRYPLKLYGWLELGAALVLSASLFLFWLFKSFFLARFYISSGVSFLLLFGYAFFLGGTLPTLAGFFQKKQEVSRLYAYNTLGAFCGAFLGGFALLPLLGISRTLWLVFSLHLFLFFLFFRSQEEAKEGGEEEHTLGEISLPVGSLLAFGTGFVLFLWEIAWGRVLSLALGASLYAHATMLGMVILALGLAAFLASSPLARKSFLYLSLGLSVVSLYLTFFLLERLPYFFLLWYRNFSGNIQWALQIFLLSLIVFLPSFFLGVAFPLLFRTTSGKSLSFTTGMLYGASTLGSLAGGLLGALWGIPLLGFQNCLLGGGIVLCFLLLLGGVRWIPLALLLSALLLLALPHPSREMLVSGVAYYAMPLRWGGDLTFHKFQKQWKESVELLFYQDGQFATVSVEHYRHHNTVFLKTNGKVEGGVPREEGKPSQADMATQILLAQLPLLLRPDSSSILVIGLGSGVTVNSALLSQAQKVVCVEIEPVVFKALQKVKAFHPYLKRFFTSKRLRLVFDDGRSFLKREREKYSLIISQPSDPWLQVSSHLFTKEFFALAKERLTKKGLFCQWVQLYHISPHLVKSLVKTFCSVFPYTYIFRPLGTEEILLVGSPSPFWLSWEEMRKRFSKAEVRKELALAGIWDLRGLLLSFLAAPEEVKQWCDEGVVNTDDNLYIETRAPYDRYRKSRSGEILRSLCAMRSNLAFSLKGAPLEVLESVAALFCLLDQAELALPILESLLEKRKSASLYFLQGVAWFLLGDGALAKRAFAEGLSIQKVDYYCLFGLLCLAMYEGDMVEAKRILSQMVREHPYSKEVRYLMTLQRPEYYTGEVEHRNLRRMAKKMLLGKLEPWWGKKKKKRKMNKRVWQRELEYALRRGRLGEARLLWKKLKEIAPKDRRTEFLEGWLLCLEGKRKGWEKVKQWAERAPLSSKDWKVAIKLARKFGELSLARKWERQFWKNRLLGSEAFSYLLKAMGEYEEAIHSLWRRIQKERKNGKFPKKEYEALMEVAWEEIQLFRNLLYFPRVSSLPLLVFSKAFAWEIISFCEKRLLAVLDFYREGLSSFVSPIQRTSLLLRLYRELEAKDFFSSFFQKEIRLRKAFLFLKEKQWKKVEGLLSQWEEQDAYYYYLRGKLALAKGNREKAKKMLRKALGAKGPFYLRRKAGELLLKLSQ